MDIINCVDSRLNNVDRAIYHMSINGMTVWRGSVVMQVALVYGGMGNGEWECR